MFSHKLCHGEHMDCGPPGPLFMAFPRQECWNGWPFPSSEDHPYPVVKSKSPVFLIWRWIPY